jgi:putative transposase
MVDSLGLIMLVVVHAANIQDRDGAKLLLGLLKNKFCRLRLIWADGAYGGKLIRWVSHLPARLVSLTLEIVKRTDDVAGFKVLPKRWIVERTFGWLSLYRRNSRDYGFKTTSSEAMIRICMIHIMVRRLA